MSAFYFSILYALLWVSGLHSGAVGGIVPLEQKPSWFQIQNLRFSPVTQSKLLIVI